MWMIETDISESNLRMVIVTAIYFTSFASQMNNQRIFFDYRGKPNVIENSCYVLFYIWKISMLFDNKNLCAWLLWHWSSRGTLQPTRPLGRVGSKFNWPSEDQCQRSHSKWVFVFIPHLKSKYSQLIVSKLPRKSAICPQRSPWRLIVLVRSLRSARLDTAWLAKSVTYFNLIG